MVLMIVIIVHPVPAGSERTMEGINAAAKSLIPAIDRRLPVQLETATFALG